MLVGLSPNPGHRRYRSPGQKQPPNESIPPRRTMRRRSRMPQESRIRLPPGAGRNAPASVALLITQAEYCGEHFANKQASGRETFRQRPLRQPGWNGFSERLLAATNKPSGHGTLAIRVSSWGNWPGEEKMVSSSKLELASTGWPEPAFAKASADRRVCSPKLQRSEVGRAGHDSARELK